LTTQTISAKAKWFQSWAVNKPLPQLFLEAVEGLKCTQSCSHDEFEAKWLRENTFDRKKLSEAWAAEKKRDKSQKPRVKLALEWVNKVDQFKNIHQRFFIGNIEEWDPLQRRFNDYAKDYVSKKWNYLTNDELFHVIKLCQSFV